MVMKIVAVGAIAATMLLTSCGGKKQQVERFPVPVKIAEAKRMDYLNSSFTGVVKAVEMSNLAFKAGGQLIKLNVEEGDKVTKGQFIAEVDPTDFQLRLEAAKAAYIKSKSQLERFTRLVERDAISKQEFEGVQAMYANDKANYENAKVMLNETKLYAPFNGIIEKRYVDNFQRVQPSEPVVALINPNNIEMKFTLSESLYSLMSAHNKQFYVSFEAYPNMKFKAKITKFVNSSSNGAGFPATVQIDDPSFSITKYNVKPGFSCTISLVVENDQYKDLVAVPATAIYADSSNGKNYVWIYDSKNSSVVKKEVQIEGLYGSDDVMLNSGVEPGQSVVIAGVYSLVNNQKVVVLKK